MGAMTGSHSDEILFGNRNEIVPDLQAIRNNYSLELPWFL
jgi:hypothetical protein